MADLFILFLALTVFGVGVTIIDFLGIMDNTGENDSSSGADNTEGDTSAEDASISGGKGSTLVHELQPERDGSLLDNKVNKTTKSEKPGIKIITRFMNLLRSAVYFSLGFGPTGLFAQFSGLSRTSGLIWAFAVGIAMIIIARLLKRFIRRDLDSSIKTNELLQEKGVLLLPLEGEEISKAVVRQYGREIEVYVRSKDKDIKYPKGKEIIIDDYDNDVYWVKPSE
ncbi:MAG: hypothetical protein FWC06_03065 [Treponema sp.]|nr:hypothetical protein [Treponema sp.]